MAKKKRQRIPIQDKLDRFFDRLSEMFGPSLSHEIKQTFVERLTTFRINTIKIDREEVRKILQQQGFKIKQLPWCKEAYVLTNKSKRELQKLDVYQEGKIYVQSLASMAPVVVLDPQPGETILDLTAAPGSKTSQIAARMNRKGELIANDKDKIRFFKLKHNMEKLGVSESHPEQGETESKDHEKKEWTFTLRMESGQTLAKEYDAYFDKILLDAPCSAEARICLKTPKTYAFWDEKNIQDNATIQGILLSAAWQALKSGGILVYSTCTFAPEENEVQISNFLAKTKDAKLLNTYIEHLHELPVITEWEEKTLQRNIGNTLRIKPTKEVEGFFVAKIRKQPTKDS